MQVELDLKCYSILFSILWSFQRLLREYQTHMFQKILIRKFQKNYNSCIASHNTKANSVWNFTKFRFHIEYKNILFLLLHFPNNYCRMNYRKNICTIDPLLRLYFTFKSSFQYHSLRRKKGCVVQILQKA